MQRFNTHLDEWNHLLEEYKDWNRNEVARLPEIMARLGMELHPVTRLRLYGEHLNEAESELKRVLALSKPAHCAMIIDLDEPQAVRIAASALALQSVSLWLFSREEPQELFQRKGKSKGDARAILIQRADGWLPRERVVLET